MQRTSKTFTLRLQVTVEAGSLEELMLEYLNDEAARPFGKTQMLMTALKPFWTTLALLSKDFPSERIVQTLQDSNYLWELHKQYLRERIESTNPGASQFLPKAEPGEDLTNTLAPASTRNTLSHKVPMIIESALENEEVKPSTVEVIDEAATEENSKPFNPFGDQVIVRQ